MQTLLDILGKIGFDWRMALFNFINFLIIFWIIKRFAFEPTLRIIDERKQKEQDAMDNYKKSKTELTMAEQKAQNHIDEAKVEANKVIERAATEAREVTDTLKSKAKDEIELLVSQAKKNIEIDKADMREALRAETVALVIKTSEKMLGKQVTAGVDEALVQEILNETK